MPYMIQKLKSGKYTVRKKNSAGKPVGGRLGTYDSEEKAKNKMKALYANEDKMKKEVAQSIPGELVEDFSGESVEETEEEMSEAFFRGKYYPTHNAKTFDQLKLAEAASAMSEAIGVRGAQMTEMVGNITWAFIYDPEQDVSTLRSDLDALFNSYIAEIEEILGVVENQEDATKIAEDELAEKNFETTMEIVETKTLSAELIEKSIKDKLFGVLNEDEEKVIQKVMQEVSEGKIEENRAPLMLDMLVIQPGWGNGRDNHYYPKEMLAEFAEAAFTGAKMYATDHRQEEKSIRTWVSTAIRLVDFTESGAPVFRVYVHDGNLAEQLRNLDKGGIVERMAGSICARGKVDKKLFEKDGRKGKRVVEISPNAGIDWVTEPGAGGQVIGLIEKSLEEGGTDMTIESTNPKAEELEEAKTEDVVINESDEETSEEETTETLISAEEKVEIIGAEEFAKLPKAAYAKLLTADYKTAEKMQEAIREEISYIEECLGESSVTRDPSTGVVTVRGNEKADDIVAPVSTEELDAPVFNAEELEEIRKTHI